MGAEPVAGEGPRSCQVVSGSEEQGAGEGWGPDRGAQVGEEVMRPP